MPSLVVELVPSPDGKAAQGAELEAFGGGHVELSLIYLFTDHTFINIWDRLVTLVGFIIFNLLLF